MPEFLQLIPVQQAVNKLLSHLPEVKPTGVESIPTRDGLGRILAEDIQAPHALPEFARSTVDGYAVKAGDTHGASPSLPAYLKLIGEIRMGREALQAVQHSEAMLIHTGAMIPPGADAVVMVEDTQQISAEEIEVMRPAAVGENVIAMAEDVQRGETVIASGSRLRPQEIGGLLALGMTEVLVFKPPRVGIISSGDEVIPPEQTPGIAQVRDINSYMLQSLVARHGGQPILRGIAGDTLEALQVHVKTSHAEDDLIVVTAGSSVSTRDLTAQVFSSLGKPGILVHGIAVKPGKPTILAVADGIPAVGLPGNPVSALVIGSLILPPIINRLYGNLILDPQAFTQARLTANLASQAGRDDYFPVHLWEDDSGIYAEPVHGRSNLIFTLVRANGLLIIPADSTGYEAGSIVNVIPF